MKRTLSALILLAASGGAALAQPQTDTPPRAPGIANQSAMQDADMTNAMVASHGFLGPVRSEIAPMRGASSATHTPTIVLARLHASWPRTGSPMTTFAKYGGNTNT